MTSPGPAACVVIIVYNDEHRLPHAINSARNQSREDIEIVVVDHGSTDGSAAIAHEHAAQDPRIRVVELGDNERKPGRPLNAGLDAATAPWVVFVGSDDALRKRACELLVAEGERTGADMVIGGVLRRDMDTRETSRWMPNVTAQSRVVTDILQFPDLIRDTIGGSKLYRTQFVRENGLRFPEDIYYQDQVFTLEYYACAQRVAIIPQYVYIWRHWYSGERQSVTQRKLTVENLSDRMEANRRIDAFLRDHGRENLLVLKQRKFLTHDLGVHVADVDQASDDYREALVAAVREYAPNVPEASFEGVWLNKQLMWQCLLAGRVDDAQRCADSHLTQMLTEWNWKRESGRTFLDPPWAPPGGAGDEVYEVTRFRFPDTPDRLQQARGWAQVRAGASALDVVITISSHGHREFDEPVAGVLEVRHSEGNAAASFPMGAPQRLDDMRRRWRVRIPLRKLDRRLDIGDGTAELHAVFHADRPDRFALRLRAAAESGDARPGAEGSTGHDPGAPATAVGHPGVGPAADSPWSIHSDPPALTLSRQPRTGWRERFGGRGAGRGNATGAVVPDADEELTWEQAQDYLNDHPVARRRGGVFFESFGGRRVAGGPLVLSRRLRERRARMPQHWSCNSWARSEVPRYAAPVRRLTRGYVDALAVSDVWVDNGWLPLDPGDRLFVQLWHGVPLTALPQDTRNPGWTHLVSSGTFGTDLLLRAAGGEPEVLPTGSPQTDVFGSQQATSRREALRRGWGIDDKTVVLCNPALRPGELSPMYRRPDLHRIAAQTGPEFFWFYREHDDDVFGRRTWALPEDLRWFVGGISARLDLSDYLLMADVLVSDYSTSIVDFGRTGRPVIHYAPDRLFFEDVTPGATITLSDLAAGPVVPDDDALIGALHAAQHARPDGRSRAFSDELAPLDARQSTDAILSALDL